jgi:hypothetical protein
VLFSPQIGYAVRPEGLTYTQAAAEWAYILNETRHEARRLRLTSVALKTEAQRLGH